MRGLFIKSILDNTEGLFSEARKGKKINIFLIIFLPIIIMFLSGILLSGAFYIFAIAASFVPEIIKYAFQINLIASTGITILLYFLFVKFIEKRSISSLGLKLEKGFIFKYLKGFLIGILMIEVVTVIIVGSGNGVFEIKGKLNLEFLVPLIITMIAWIIQGASEEIMIRGHMLPKLGVKVGAVLAIIISSSYFGLLHLGNPGVSKISILNLILFGVFSAVYALQEKSILGVCALHSAWNFAQGNIFGFLVSGLKAEGGSIMVTTVTDNEIITGGAFGPEGGLAVTIVLVVGVILVSFYAFKKGSSRYK